MEKNNEYGKIKITHNVFHRIVKNSLEMTNQRVSLNTERKNIFVCENEDSIIVEFMVIIKFGASIQTNSDMILDHIENTIKPMNIGKPVHIVMKIVGIRSKNIAKRDIEVTRDIN